jgi:hypothetical protein
MRDATLITELAVLRCENREPRRAADVPREG